MSRWHMHGNEKHHQLTLSTKFFIGNIQVAFQKATTFFSETTELIFWSNRYYIRKAMEILALKKLGFGTLRLPLPRPDDVKSIDQNLLNQLVDEFMKAGYTYFETGWPYHSQYAEDACRKAIVERYPREKFCLADNMPTYNLKKVRIMRIFSPNN
jgi:hypothetical protein